MTIPSCQPELTLVYSSKLITHWLRNFMHTRTLIFHRKPDMIPPSPTLLGWLKPGGQLINGVVEPPSPPGVLSEPLDGAPGFQPSWIPRRHDGKCWPDPSWHYSLRYIIGPVSSKLRVTIQTSPFCVLRCECIFCLL